MWLSVLAVFSVICVCNSVAVYMLWKKNQHLESLHGQLLEQ